MAARSRLKNDHSERTMGTPQAHSLGPPSSASSRVPIVQAPLLQSPCHNPGHQGHLESHSPSLAVGPQTRDSGYNTDVSPATTSSPATNANTRQHFVFDNLSHITESSAHCSYPSAAGTPVPFSSPRSPRIHVLCDPRTRKKGTPPLRLSPEIFKIAEQKCSPKPVSETSETHVAVFDFEIDENVPEKHDDLGLGHLEGAESADDLDLTEPRLPGGNAIDENLLYNPDGILRNWGQNPEYTTRGRASSFCSRPRRRHCSTGDNNFAETQEWCDEVAEVGSFSQRSFSFSESFSNNIPYGSVGHPDSIDLGVLGLQRRSRFFQLYSSQGFQSGCHDNSVSRSNSCDSENVFNFDLDDEQEDAPTDKAPHRSSQGVPIVREKPPHSPASTSRLHRRRVGIASSHLVTSSGVRLPHSGTILGVSVATQTPHAASALIQQLLSTPVPLPNEAIGPAASSLRRRSSASGALPGLPSSLVPLPDIVPTTGRDRSNSVPDFHAYERATRARETGRQVGRELRRMSDEFNAALFGARRLSPVREDLDGYPASFPITRPLGFLQNVRSFFVQESFSRASLPRQESSVDLLEQSTPEEDNSSTEELTSD